MIPRRVTGNATLGAVTEPSTLITNKKLTLQLFRVRWPSPSQHFVGTFQGHPNSCVDCSTGLFIALFTEADTPPPPRAHTHTHTQAAWWKGFGSL